MPTITLRDKGGAVLARCEFTLADIQEMPCWCAARLVEFARMDPRRLPPMPAALPEVKPEPKAVREELPQSSSGGHQGRAAHGSLLSHEIAWAICESDPKLREAARNSEEGLLPTIQRILSRRRVVALGDDEVRALAERIERDLTKGEYHTAEARIQTIRAVLLRAVEPEAVK